MEAQSLKDTDRSKSSIVFFRFLKHAKSQTESLFGKLSPSVI